MTNSAKTVVCTSIVGAVAFCAGAFIPVLTLPVILTIMTATISTSYSRGVRGSLSTALLISLAIDLLVHPLISILYLSSFALPGTIIGRTARRPITAGDLLIFTVIISILAKLISLFAIYQLTGTNFLFHDPAEIESALTELAASGLLRLPGVEEGDISNVLKNAVNSYIMLAPFTMIVFIVIESLASLKLSTFVCRRFMGAKSDLFKMPRLSDIAFPKNSLLVLIAAFVLDIIASQRDGDAVLMQISLNLTAVARSLFIIQGVAMTAFFAERKGLPRALAIILIPLSFLISIAGDILSMVGIADLSFDIRKKMKGEGRR